MGVRTPQDKAIDPASIAMLEKAAADGAPDAFARADAQGKGCTFGTDGVCCRLCHMGPCRITTKSPLGVCGADADTIAARNLLREVAAGAAAHSDHGRALVLLLKAIAEGRGGDYQIKDEHRLRTAALEWGIDISGGDGRPPLTAREIAARLADVFLSEFALQEGKLRTLSLAPLPRQGIWDRLGLSPGGIDRSIVEALHRTHMGVDHDYHNLVHGALRTALADGWGGSMIATTVSDILFGTPEPVRGCANLGVLEARKVNVLVHGHDPALTEILVAAAYDPEIVSAAQAVGAEGVNLAGICCTANEVLMRHGVPVAGNFLQQELAIVTGAADAMVVDVQCEMQSLAQVAKCYHTKLITTSAKAKIEGATHIQFEEHNAPNVAKRILMEGVQNFKNRKANVEIPSEITDQVVGFSHETINYLLGGVFRASYRPLNDNIINGRIRGIAGVVGCNNARVTHDDPNLTLIKELIKNDVIVLVTGCSAMTCGKAGLLTPEATDIYAGAGLASVGRTVGIPPVLHMGACVDNSRILMAATAVVKDGGLGDDISDLPAAGAALEWMSEKAIAIGHYFVASGVYTVFGTTFPTIGSDTVSKYLFEELENSVKGKWGFEPDPMKAAKLMIEHIDKKRKALGIDKSRDRVLFDMAKRRELDAA